MSNESPESGLDPRLAKFCKAFSKLNNCGTLFPKKCRTCSQIFKDISQYVEKTVPKAHVFEDCSDVMGKPYTMMYRHCSCGNTLVTTLTEDTFSELDELWATLRKVAKDSGRPLNKVVEEFCGQCDKYLTSCHIED